MPNTKCASVDLLIIRLTHPVDIFTTTRKEITQLLLAERRASAPTSHVAVPIRRRKPNTRRLSRAVFEWVADCFAQAPRPVGRVGFLVGYELGYGKCNFIRRGEATLHSEIKQFKRAFPRALGENMVWLRLFLGHRKRFLEASRRALNSSGILWGERGRPYLPPSM